MVAGTRAAPGQASASAALGVLFELASSPATAPDALALLHELQVHQVELELQDEELRDSRAELEQSLRRHVSLYDEAPVAYLTLDGGGLVHELNLTCAAWLAAPREALLGSSLGRFLEPASVAALQNLLAATRTGAPAGHCSLRLQAVAGVRRHVHATACADTVDGRYRVVLVDLGREEGHAAP
jgi:PAS domain-containing protein